MYFEIFTVTMEYCMQELVISLFFFIGNICLQSMGINQLMQYGYAELKYIIDWAKKVPGKSRVLIAECEKIG